MKFKGHRATSWRSLAILFFGFAIAFRGIAADPFPIPVPDAKPHPNPMARPMARPMANPEAHAAANPAVIREIAPRAPPEEESEEDRASKNLWRKLMGDYNATAVCMISENWEYFAVRVSSLYTSIARKADAIQSNTRIPTDYSAFYFSDIYFRDHINELKMQTCRYAFMNIFFFCQKSQSMKRNPFVLLLHQNFALILENLHCITRLVPLNEIFDENVEGHVNLLGTLKGLEGT
jgi:hypothetical protein